MSKKMNDLSFLKPTSQQVALPSHSGRFKLFILIIMALLACGYVWYVNTPKTEPVVLAPENKPAGAVLSGNLPAEIKPTEQDIKLATTEVKWQEPLKSAPLSSLGLPQNITDADGNTVNWQHQYYKSGKITTGQYNGWNLYIVLSKALCDKEVCDSGIIRLAEKNQRVIILSRYSFPEHLINQLSVEKDPSVLVPGLESPKTINASDVNLTLAALPVNGWEGMFSPKGLTPAFNSRELGQFYKETESARISRREIFYAKMPDGTAAVYYLQPPFISQGGFGGVAEVVWNSGERNLQEYAFRMSPECGVDIYADVAMDIKPEDLIPAGKTIQGDTIYQYKDSKEPFLNKIYADNFQSADNKLDSISYDAFLAGHPVFFWQDPLGRYIRFVDNKFTGCN